MSNLASRMSHGHSVHAMMCCDPCWHALYTSGWIIQMYWQTYLKVVSKTSIDCLKAVLVLGVIEVRYDCRDLLYGLWDYEEFRRLHLKEYMVMCQGFGADFTSKDM